MSKPVIFFSHSSRDAAPLARLKELFVAKTGGTIDVFLSSDGQSIPLGRNWVHRIEEALAECRIMMAFLSPFSIQSNWLYFEAGFVYSKNIEVIPLGFLGVDLNSLHLHLSLLQGFNITSSDGLDNIINVANKSFEHQHREIFFSKRL